MAFQVLSLSPRASLRPTSAKLPWLDTHTTSAPLLSTETLHLFAK